MPASSRKPRQTVAIIPPPDETVPHERDMQIAAQMIARKFVTQRELIAGSATTAIRGMRVQLPSGEIVSVVLASGALTEAILSAQEQLVAYADAARSGVPGQHIGGPEDEAVSAPVASKPLH